MQILWLCKNISKEEWSGVLFYSTEGELGEKDFSLKVHELFLMDIGNSTYTGYKPTDPLLIKHLMANPHLMTLKIGHIHSHHNMSVFFSGTDKDELIDNSPFHNFYFSLIVNNSNHMDARVAFKAEVQKQEKTTTRFRGVSGDYKEKERNSATHEEVIYAYECEIGREGDPEEFFQNRFLEVQQQCKSQRTQKSLFQTHEEAAEDTESLYSFGGTKQSGSFWAPPAQSYREDSATKAPAETGSISKMIYSLTAKIISLDSSYRGSLEDALSKRSDAFFGPRKWRHDFESYCENIRGMAVRFYKYMYPEDKKCVALAKTLIECAGVVELYEKDFPQMVEGVTTALLMQAQKS
jgi:hypothetical protein